ncbi:rod shape-determining protein MreD [Chlamydiota bacterium]
MRYIPLIICILFFGVIEFVIIQKMSWDSLYSVDLLAILTILLSLKFGWIRTGLIAFFCGFFQDIFSGSPLGIGSISFAAGAFISGSFRWILFSEHLTTRLCMVFIGSIVILLSRFICESLYYHQLLSFPISLFFQTILPSAVCNVIVSLLIYPICKKFIFISESHV